MSLLKDLTFKFKQGDVDTAGRPLQVLETVHRAALMAVKRGKPQAGESYFSDPIGKPNYYGFGKDGYYYEGGLKSRIWRQQESIDDFADQVTDIERWDFVAAVPDFTEGGIDVSLATGKLPFGLRLYANYVGPAAQVFGRRGRMVHAIGSAPQIALSSRLSVEGSPLGVGLDSCILLCIQDQLNEPDFVFVGMANTTTYPHSVVYGESVGGVLSVKGSVAIPIVNTEIEVAIELLPATYRGLYSLSPTAEDYTGASWNSIGLSPWVGGWANVVPRFYASYPASFPVGEFHRATDVRNEIGSGTWEGQQRASWWLETQDATRDPTISGTRPDCPDELMVTWERSSADGICVLSLIDTDTPTDPKLWRRWQLGKWKDWDRITSFRKFSPGWLDADEGHIVFTPNTGYAKPGIDIAEMKGEIWVVSLRWDKVLVFRTDGIGTVLVLPLSSPSFRVLRETGSWGSRFWMPPIETDTGTTIYDYLNLPSSGFVGTCRKGGSETVVPATTYGVSVRISGAEYPHVSYGIQENAASIGLPGKYFAGVIRLEEGPSLAFPRWLFRKDDAAYDVWDETDEGWMVTGLTFMEELWWTQAGEYGAFDELEGVLCRRAFSVDAPNNLSTAPYLEDDFWRGTDFLGGHGLSMNIMDSNPPGNEVVLVSSGWLAGSYLTSLFYNGASPGASVFKTMGPAHSGLVVTDEMKTYHPSNEYPKWIVYQSSLEPLDLERCRVSTSAGVGQDSFVPQLSGFWSAFGKFNGLVGEEFKFTVARSVPISREDFVLDFSARLLPPFSAGYRFNAINQMSSGQVFSVSFGVMGDKYAKGAFILRMSGNKTGSGGLFLGAYFAFIQGSGLNTQVGSGSLAAAQQQAGGLLQFRLKRVGAHLDFLSLDPGTGTFVRILEADGLRIPLVPYIEVSVSDSVGIPCGAGLEIDEIRLAPLGDPSGKTFHRSTNYATIPSKYGYVAGGAVFRENVPTDSSGSIIVADSWVFPGLMPRP